MGKKLKLLSKLSYLVMVAKERKAPNFEGLLTT